MLCVLGVSAVRKAFGAAASSPFAHQAARSFPRLLSSSPVSISETIRQRLEAAKAPYFANDNIAEHLLPGELDKLQAEVQGKIEAMLQSLVIDTKRDHNTNGTAERVARMYIQEVFKGRYKTAPKITDFPNCKDLDEIYSVGPITVRSACSHHLVPILGRCWIGIHPGTRVIGLSKFNRLCEWVFSRPHIQEEAVIILSDEIERLVAPKGLIVIVQAQHYCMKWRGVKEPETKMTTSVVRGVFREQPQMKAEFLQLIGMKD
jgi:GTP cyclohydrolase IA